MHKLIAVLAALAPLSAHAGSFTPPEGCATYMTVQARGCNVANYYRCEADAAGDQWRADFDQEGLYYLSRIDAETQWVESHDLNPPSVQTLDAGPTDPASFTDLLATGRDDFVFSLSTDTGEHTHVRGYDRLTGQEVVIDGVTLKQTEFQMTETDDAGQVLREARGNEFISVEHRTFFSGSSEYNTPEGWLPLEGSPVQFSFDGDKGFGATQPIFDCDAVLSALPQGGGNAG